MTTQSTSRLAWLLCIPLLAIPACSIFGGKKGGPKKVEDLLGWVERVYVDTELAKQEMGTAVTRLQKLVRPGFEEDVVRAYQQLASAVERSEVQGKKLNKSVRAMQEASRPVFAQWRDNLDKFSSTGMRQRSQQRLRETEDRYQAIDKLVGPAAKTYLGLNKNLKDSTLFLQNDINEAALETIRPDVQALIDVATALDERFSETLQAAQAYIDAAALPGRRVDDENVAPEAGKGTRRGSRDQSSSANK